MTLYTAGIYYQTGNSSRCVGAFTSAPDFLSGLDHWLAANGFRGRAKEVAGQYVAKVKGRTGEFVLWPIMEQAARAEVVLTHNGQNRVSMYSADGAQRSITLEPLPASNKPLACAFSIY